jgi:hypothetical protein
MDSTMDSKIAYKHLTSSFGVDIKGYHADNGQFADLSWKDACNYLNQNSTFCGIGAHHQNGIAECCIRDLADSAHAALLHAMHCWPDGISKNLWLYALCYVSLIWNKV